MYDSLHFLLPNSSLDKVLPKSENSISALSSTFPMWNEWSFPGADQNMTSVFYKLTSVQSAVPNLHCGSMINFTSSWVALQEQSHMHAAVPGWLLPWLLPCLWSSKTFPDVRKFILTTASEFRAASLIMAAQARLTKTGPIVQACFCTWVMRSGVR